MNGFVKLHRSLIDWEWFTEPNTVVVWIYILLRANHKANRWQGMDIEAGSFITSVAKMSAETSLSEKQIRTALKHLKETGEVAIETTNRYTLIRVSKWFEYQCDGDCLGEQKGEPRANEGQTKGKQRATNKNDKNDKNEKNIYILGEFKNVKLAEEELRKLYETYGEFTTKRAIQFLSEYIQEKGYKSKSHYLAIKRWVITAVQEKESRKPVSIAPTIQSEPVYDDANNYQASEEELEEIRKLMEGRNA